MSRRPKPSLIASLLAVLCLGAGGGALLYAAFGPTQSKPAAQPVTVKDSQPASTTSPLSIPQIYRSAYKGVVQIAVSTQGSSPFGGSQAQQALGSGWVYDSDGNIVTNAHVADGAKKISVQFWNGKTYPATLVGSDPSSDIAVVHVSAPDSQLFPLTVGDSSKLEVGDGVVAIGSPFGLSETVTSGIVSALHRSIEGLTHFTIPDSIQTDAAINHGNSGGPLLDTEAHVVGMNSQIRSDSGGNEGVGFAIPSNTVRSIATQLISTGKAVHAYLGVAIDATASTAKIASVKAATPAAQAGLKAGDVVTAVDGTSIASGDDLTRAIDSHKPGDTITLKYRRGGSEHTADLKLAARPS